MAAHSWLQSWKNTIIFTTGVEKDGMHVIVGMLVFLLAAMLMRRPLRDIRPFLTVLVIAVLGEIWDAFDFWRAGEAIQWDSAVHDLWVTCLCPFLLFALTRWTRLIRA